MSGTRYHDRVSTAGADLGVDVEVTTFPSGTRTATDAAAAIGCPVAAICKSLVFATDAGPVLVLCSGANRVDERKVVAALGTDGVRIATPDEARAATGFPIGGTPPFAHDAELRVLADVDLFDHEVVWAAAGTPDAVFPVAPEELARAAGAVRAEVSVR